jgi:YegS/Rv2252/BmrU family lipid kinase
MTSVAVVAHRGKSLDGGLPALRERLVASGVTDPIWCEVPKSKKAAKRVREAIERGADLVFIWGGDGMVQRCIDAAAGSGVTLAIIPAGTANLLASNLGIPKHLDEAVDVGLHGVRRDLDLGVVNGEHFAVMAGTGFDALMMRDADAGLKDKVGRLAYVVTGAKNLRAPRAKVRIRVDGHDWFEGRASCVLFGNVGKLFGGLTAFEHARPDDGRLELGVVTAKGPAQWARALARTATKQPQKSKFVELTSGTEFDVKLDRKIPFELDGGDRPAAKRLKVAAEPAAITVCVPDPMSA